ncbi:MAG TPA: hypothetical protein VGT60_05990 [Candidatus Limnocylindria bacterium]|nr:hypothetical protein [Candidatus Limnocylindria bacterium]
MRALVAPLFLLLTVTGAALAAPVPVLALGSIGTSITLPLAEGERFTSSYVQSIYRVPVIEELERHADAVRLLRVRSTDRRAVEYFGWHGEIRSEGGWYIEEAPPVELPQLVIRTTAMWDQRISEPNGSVPLAARFGDEARVTVRPITVARLVAVLTAR